MKISMLYLCFFKHYKFILFSSSYWRSITIVAIVGFELVNKNMKNKQELAYKTNDFLMRINRN